MNFQFEKCEKMTEFPKRKNTAGKVKQLRTRMNKEKKVGKNPEQNAKVRVIKISDLSVGEKTILWKL